MNKFIKNYLKETIKLDGTNYSNWKFKLQTFLEGESAWLIVCSDEQKLNSAATATTLIQDWDKRENKVKFLLKMFVKENIIPHIRDGKSSTEICTTLKNLYHR